MRSGEVQLTTPHLVIYCRQLHMSSTLSNCNCESYSGHLDYVSDELPKATSTHFVPDLRSCILGFYDENVDNVKIINTVMLLVEMYIMNC